MLTLDIGYTEAYNEETEEFFTVPGTLVELEHSLVSISKWESFYEKPFLGKEQKTVAETIDYVRMMTLTPDVPAETFAKLSDKNVQQVSKYIDAKMTATWFNDPPGPTAKSQEIITSEVIYYWLIALNIPFECQYWHLNRLMTLVKVCNQKNKPTAPKKKFTRGDLAARGNLNAQRRAQMNTSG